MIPLDPRSESTPEGFDCQRCGACCYGDEMWIHLLVDDDERLGPTNAEKLTTLTRHGRGFVARSMRMVDGHCIAYSTNLGDGRCGCTIYSLRPDICRDFEAGSPGCRAARARRGIKDEAR